MVPFRPITSRWRGGLCVVHRYAVLAFLALAAYGGAVLQVRILPSWSGWLTVAYSAAMLVLLLLSGDALPAFHYAPPLLIGILLVAPK